MAQFDDGKSTQGQCPICGASVPIRTTRGAANYCSQKCASQRRYAKRYQGTLSGPLDKPTLLEKTKL